MPVLLLLLSLLGCQPTPNGAEEVERGAGPASVPAPAERSAAPRATVAPQPETAAHGPPDTSSYPWHADPTLEVLPAVDHLDERLGPPQGFKRVSLDPHSFGAWLRHLPLAAADTPVKAYDGRILHRAGDPHIAAVTTLDVGKADLQQCADAVMRLHAEWAWSQGRRDMSYQAASGMPLPFARWSRGERLVPEGRSLRWVPSGRAGTDHRALRKYLDAVFGWANTVSLGRQARPVPLDELRPGDFFVLPGNPGHTVLVLDLARSGKEIAVLLGQSYMPAQSFQILRPQASQTWFRIDPSAEGVQTPFWPAPFPWSSLRRLD